MRMEFLTTCMDIHLFTMLIAVHTGLKNYIYMDILNIAVPVCWHTVCATNSHFTLYTHDILNKMVKIWTHFKYFKLSYFSLTQPRVGGSSKNWTCTYWVLPSRLVCVEFFGWLQTSPGHHGYPCSFVQAISPTLKGQAAKKLYKLTCN